MKKFILLMILPILLFKDGGAVELNDILTDPYPEVYENVDLMPFDPFPVWYNHHAGFSRLIPAHNVKVAIEVGSWIGTSTRDIAKLMPEDGVVYAVDTWKGSEEHHPGSPHYYMPLDLIFRQFLSNVIHENLQHKIIPVRMTSMEAAEKLKLLGIKADFIYLDAAHDYASVMEDLNAWYPYLNEGGIFCGDDFCWHGVHWAVKNFAAENNLQLIVDTYWRLVKKNP